MSRNAPLSHEAFVRRYRAGEIEARMSKKAAQEILDDVRRGPPLWEPGTFFLQRSAGVLAVVGGLLLVAGGRVILGGGLLVLGTVFLVALERDPRKRVLEAALDDEELYHQLLQRGHLEVPDGGSAAAGG